MYFVRTYICNYNNIKYKNMGGFRIKPFLIWDEEFHRKKFADAMDKVGEKIKDFFSDKDEVSDHDTSVKTKKAVEDKYLKEKRTRNPDEIKDRVNRIGTFFINRNTVDSVPKGMEDKDANLRADAANELQKEASRGVLAALNGNVPPVNDIAGNMSQGLFNEAQERNRGEQENQVRGLSV